MNRVPATLAVTAFMVLSAALLILAAGTVVPQETATPTATPIPQPSPKPTRTPAPKTLSELAATIKLRTPTPAAAGEPKEPLITNETVYPDGRRTPGPADGTSDWLSPKDQEEARKRDKWREKYRQALQHQADLEHELAELDKEIPALQTKYYSWDDPAYRDNVIKPELDERMAQAKKVRAELAEAERQPSTVKRDARRDGAKPGWFRGVKINDPGSAPPQ